VKGFTPVAGLGNATGAAATGEAKLGVAVGATCGAGAGAANGFGAVAKPCAIPDDAQAAINAVTKICFFIRTPVP
jgi:hypothetical protein